MLSLACGSWQVRQSRTAGGWTVPLMSAAFLSAWQVMQSADGSGGDELDAGDVFVDPDLVAAQAARGHGGMNRLALCFVLVALEAFGGGRVLIERDGMNRGAGARRVSTRGARCKTGRAYQT